jgi:hypothetical protein
MPKVGFTPRPFRLVHPSLLRCSQQLRARAASGCSAYKMQVGVHLGKFRKHPLFSHPLTPSGNFGREITKNTGIYGVYLQFWPTLVIYGVRFWPTVRRLHRGGHEGHTLCLSIFFAHYCMYVHVCVRVCVHACVRACVCTCVRAGLSHPCPPTPTSTALIT